MLGGHDSIADVTVIGVPNDELRATLASYCRELLAGFKVPRSYGFVDELPRTGTGKIRAPSWEGHDHQI